MPNLRIVNADFYKPYITVLEFFRYTGINLFDETNIWFFKFKHLHIVALIIFITMSFSHWHYFIKTLLDGIDLLDLCADLSFCYNSVEGIILYIYICIIKNRMQTYVFKLEKQWRDDSTLLPHVVVFKQKKMNEFDRINSVYCKSIQVYRNLYMAYPVVVGLFKRYILRQDALYSPILGFNMPFEYKDNTLKFFCIYILEYTGVIILSTILNCCILLLIVTMNQLKILFILVHEDFKEIIRSNDKDVDIKLKQTIQRHSILTEFLGQFGGEFGAIFAIHLFFSTFTVCFYAISAKINKRWEDFKNVLIGSIITVSTFYGCIHGQYVTESAQYVADAIYESTWEDLSVRNQKLLLFTMLRSQQATYIESTSFVNICMDTFKNVMKTTWSLISLITTVYED